MTEQEQREDANEIDAFPGTLGFYTGGATQPAKVYEAREADREADRGAHRADAGQTGDPGVEGGLHPARYAADFSADFSADYSADFSADFSADYSMNLGNTRFAPNQGRRPEGSIPEERNAE